jgi:hypothetical protein
MTGFRRDLLPQGFGGPLKEVSEHVPEVAFGAIRMRVRSLAIGAMRKSSQAGGSHSVVTKLGVFGETSC